MSNVSGLAILILFQKSLRMRYALGSLSLKSWTSGHPMTGEADLSRFFVNEN